MKKTALRYGSYSVIALIIFFIVEWFIFRNKTGDFNLREIVGWAGILLSTSFVYFGLKYYRDMHNGGELSFGEGLKLGVLLIILPALAFGIFNVIYILYLDPNFLDTYYNYHVEQLKNTVPLAEQESKIKEIQEQKEMFTSPFIQFISMFLSVFVVGLIVTIISTLILKRKVSEPALT